MSYLLDTHSFLWFINDDASLGSLAKNIIQEPNNRLYLSAASIWEIAIKVSLGKLDIPSPFQDFIEEQLIKNDIDLLPIKIAHTAIVARLPFHHRDPFDRLIIAQSLAESLAIIGTDAVFDQYGVKRLW